MLKQIIFMLTSSHPDCKGLLTEDIRCVRQHMEEYQVWVKEVFVDSDPSAVIALEENAHTLYAADNPEMLNKLLEAGCYGVALLHAWNRQEIFSRALYAVDEIREIEYDFFRKAYERLAGLPWHIADTLHLRIRETTVSDVEAFYRIYSHPSITRHMEGLYRSVREEKAYAEEYIQKVYGFFGYGIWTVLLRETGEIIGRAGISWREGYRYPELGFVIAREHQRKGYGEEACEAILAFAKKELEFDCIQVLIEPENEPSVSLCRKLGFEGQGTVVVKEKEHLFMLKRLSCLF